jgi:hypothetical protein
MFGYVQNLCVEMPMNNIGTIIRDGHGIIFCIILCNKYFSISLT